MYDALGRRTEKQHISPDGKPYNRTKFLWDGMRLAQESRPEGTGSLYIYRDQGSYEPLARVDKAGKEGPNRILYFHTDVNGAPEEMTDSDGRIVWETGYQVWGNTIQEKDHCRVEQNLRYQGQYLDRETGLHYNLHRYYDPDVGRFMVTDPIGLLGGLNLYQYAPNPISWIDPLGLTGEWVNPKDINFSQRTISPHDYADIMRNGGWDWDRSPLRVIDMDGQLVSYDNRRLDAALEAGLDKVKVIRVDPNAPHPDSPTGKTWLQKF
ncbi:RHS Repeat family protein [Escherichia coli]|nr:RHS Repeat family protein [Escherichia coli]